MKALHKTVVLLFAACLPCTLALADGESSTWIAIDGRKASERKGQTNTVDYIRLQHTNGERGIDLVRDKERPSWGRWPAGTWRYVATPITGCDYEVNHELTFGPDKTVTYVGVVLIPAPIRNVPYYASWYSNTWSRHCFGYATTTDVNTVTLTFNSSMTIRKCSGTYTNLDSETVRFTINGELLEHSILRAQ